MELPDKLTCVFHKRKNI